MGECSSCGWLMNSADADILRFLNQFAYRSLAWDGFVATLEYASLFKGVAIMAGFLWICGSAV